MLSRRTFIMSLTLASMGFTLPSLAEDEPGIKVRQTVEAIDRYQKWVARGDYDRVQRSWLEVSKLWQSLDYVEQQSVEKLRPGTRRWMESGEDYSDGLSDPPGYP